MVDFRGLTDDVYDAQCTLRKGMEWDKWVEEIPYIEWPKGWQVKAIPPFSGAVIRYLIKRFDTPDRHRVSVYLDCYGMLGAHYEPYWEVYPGNSDGDTNRCNMNEIDELKRQIQLGLNYLSERADD
jgi:hypothetical protein